MKDYTINKEDRNMFILSYRIKKGNIIVKLASGEKYVVPYSEENEQIILDRMKEQVTESIDFEREAVKEYLVLILATIVLGIATLFFAGKHIPSLVAHPTLKTILSNIPTFIGLGLTSLSAMYVNQVKETLEDFRKNKLYLKTETKLNERIKDNKNILSNVSNRTKKMVAKTPANKPVFDINKMDKVTLKDLKQILENFKRDEDFGFDYSKPKKLIRTKEE